MAENDDVGTIGPDVAARLIMVEPGAFDQLVRRGWFKPVGVRRATGSSRSCRAMRENQPRDAGAR
jgi:hypothetical protein